MDQFVELLHQINVAQVFVIFVGVWLVYSRLDSKIDKLDQKMDSKFERLDERLGKLDEKVQDMDRRLCRIEGSLATHGHCLFNQSHKEKRAE